MKNIILTASIVTNLFVCGLLYEFSSGGIVKSQQDYVSVLDDLRPVKYARK